MNNEINNIDDLFDDEIGKSLRQLGLIFPKTVEDFEKIENQIKKNKIAQPNRLKDPISFLSDRNFKTSKGSKQEEGQKLYLQNLAQAAREGKIIPEDIKKKMIEDKLGSNKKKENL